MGKSKRKLNDLSILSTFVLLAVVFLLLAMLLVEAERTLLTNAQRDIAFQYSDVVEGFNSEKVWGNQSVYLLSEHDGRMMWPFQISSATSCRRYRRASHFCFLRQQIQPLGRSHHIVQLISILKSLIELERIFRFIGSTAFGGYHDNTICRT